MHDPKRLGLINALLANRADTPVPTPPRTLSSLSRGLLGLEDGLGALSSFHVPLPHVRGALEQVFADSEHDRLVEKLRSWLVSSLYSDIKVDLPSCEKPDRIVWANTKRGHEPDATAYFVLESYRHTPIAQEINRFLCLATGHYVRHVGGVGQCGNHVIALCCCGGRRPGPRSRASCR